MIIEKFAMRALCLCLSILVVIQPAEARRFRIFGIPSFGNRETIDLVYDLPDREPFAKDGEYLDLGVLNGRYKHGYVLYHGDRYRELDDEGLALLTRALGFDPTAQYKAQYALDHADEIAEAKAEQEHKDALIANGRMIERKPGESSESYQARAAAFIKDHRSGGRNATPAQEAGTSTAPVSGGVPFGLFLFFVVIVGGVLLSARKLIGAISGTAKAVIDTDGDSGEFARDVDTSSFDQRVAKRLAELQSGGQAAAPDPYCGSGGDFAAQAELPRPPLARGFGRKAV